MSERESFPDLAPQTYLVNRLWLFEQVVTFIDLVELTFDRVRQPWYHTEWYDPSGEHREQTVDVQTLQGMKRVAFSLYLDLRNVGLANRAREIVDYHWTHPGEPPRLDRF